MPREPYAKTVERWRQFLAQVEETGVKVPGPDGKMAELAAMHERAQQLVTERAVLKAAMQTATQELQEILEKGRMKHTVLRLSLKEELGDGNELLVAFGIRPSRKRSQRRKKPVPLE